MIYNGMMLILLHGNSSDSSKNMREQISGRDDITNTFFPWNDSGLGQRSILLHFIPNNKIRLIQRDKFIASTIPCLPRALIKSSSENWRDKII
jgi:hypothetical protein